MVLSYNGIRAESETYNTPLCSSEIAPFFSLVICLIDVSRQRTHELATGNKSSKSELGREKVSFDGLWPRNNLCTITRTPVL